MKITIETRDNVIWNKDKIALQIAKSMSTGDTIDINLNKEGPDCQQIGLYDLLKTSATLFNYSLKNITIHTCNALEKHKEINIIFTPSLHLLCRELNKKYDFNNIEKKFKLKHFGSFVGRSNAPRLLLSTYLHKHHNDKSILTYQYKFNDDYHRTEIGFESLINDFNKKNISDEASFLEKCPRQIFKFDFKFDKNNSIDFSSELHKQEKGKFIDLYKEFFLEVVSETYYSGNSFFLTEKIFRPILLKTPFIVQGPKFFLKNLSKLGFKTFDKWWDEGYSKDPYNWQPTEIIKVLNTISQFDQKKINQILQEMQPVLIHNQQTLLNLNETDFKKAFNYK